MKKKVLLGLLIGTAPFMLAACGSKDKDKEKEKAEAANTKTISCSGDREGKISVTFKYDTKEETVKSGSMTYEMDISKYSEAEQEQIKKLNLCDSFKNDERYSDCKPLNSDSALGVDLNFNIDKLLEEYSAEEKKISVEDFAKDFEDELNVKCEIK